LPARQRSNIKLRHPSRLVRDAAAQVGRGQHLDVGAELEDARVPVRDLARLPRDDIGLLDRTKGEAADVVTPSRTSWTLRPMAADTSCRRS